MLRHDDEIVPMATELPPPDGTSSWWCLAAQAFAKLVLEAAQSGDERVLNRAAKACRAFSPLATAARRYVDLREIESAQSEVKSMVSQIRAHRRHGTRVSQGGSAE